MSAPSSSLLSHSAGAITDVAGIEVGHFTETRRPTGCTVIMAREGAVAGVDVRGAAPGTRETDLLSPGNLVQQIHAVMLAGGSAWGLAAAEGAMRWMEERGIGMDVRFGTLPIVPAAVLFDLPMGDARTEDGTRLLDTRRALLRGDSPKPLLAGTNTTIGVIATDAVLTKVQANRLAMVAHDGLARSINPVHTMSDGDTLFALATGRVPLEGDAPGMTVLSTMAAEVAAIATLRAVLAARTVTVGELHIPCAADLGKARD